MTKKPWLAKTQSGLRGFSRSNLFRMCQFCEVYAADEKVSPLVRQLPWTHHHLILGRAKLTEVRELEQQLKSGRVARAVLAPAGDGEGGQP